MFFGANGRRLSTPVVRLKPGVTGPDGGNTSFFLFDLGFEVPGTSEPDGIPNFFGTSASAPHVAAVAALILDQRARDMAARKRFAGPRKLTPDLIYWAMRLTADDMKLRNFGGDIGPQRVDNANGLRFRYRIRIRGRAAGAARDSWLLTSPRFARRGFLDKPVARRYPPLGGYRHLCG